MLKSGLNNLLEQLSPKGFRLQIEIRLYGENAVFRPFWIGPKFLTP